MYGPIKQEYCHRSIWKISCPRRNFQYYITLLEISDILKSLNVDIDQSVIYSIVFSVEKNALVIVNGATL